MKDKCLEYVIFLNYSTIRINIKPIRESHVRKKFPKATMFWLRIGINGDGGPA